MRVLLPVDGSEASERTLIWATGFLSPDAAVYLLYVADPRFGTPMQEVVDDLLKKAQTIFRTKGYPTVYTHHEIGMPADVICQFADENNIPMIIIGAQGKTALGKLLMGSISAEVFQKAKQQVLVLNNTPRPSLTMSIDSGFTPGQPT